MVRLGLDLPPELLALACASHSGEPFHLDGVRRILALADLEVDALQTPRTTPRRHRQGRGDPGRRGANLLAMNCSGKHAAMLLTCVVNGWDTTTYRSPDHPLQQGIATSLRRADRRAGRGDRGRRVRRAAAVRVADRAGAGLPHARHRDRRSGAPGRRGDPCLPAYVSGSTRDELRLLTAVPAPSARPAPRRATRWPCRTTRVRAQDRRRGARARPVVMAEALRRSGVPTEPGVDADALDTPAGCRCWARASRWERCGRRRSDPLLATVRTPVPRVSPCFRGM